MQGNLLKLGHLSLFRSEQRFILELVYVVTYGHPSSESERSSACEYQCYLTYLSHTSKTTNMVSTSGLVFVLFALAVGREGVLSASSARELRCGRRLVSGLFSRPRLPLGYSYVTTVPRGACRLNVSEITPTDNYIALKISNGSYIMNGEFAVSAAGTYEAAGARFVYSREGSLDSVLAPGPIQQAIDIMILYTQPNPSIKYEYFTDSLPGEVETESVTKEDFTDVTPTTVAKHYRRHHSYDTFSRPSVVVRNPTGSKELSTDNEFDVVFTGNRKFLWKIMSYSPCTRSCGGGIQLGKYRCVDLTANDHEVPSSHCFGTAPPPRRRRCGGSSCPPRWRAAAWSQCPKCGPATKTRIVGCVQDHSKGITKISDQKCPAPKPTTTETCDIPDCKSGSEVRPVASKRVLRPREHTDAFREGPVYSVAVNSTDLDVGPEYSFSATAGWLYTEWSECVGWCVGGGMQTRNVRCADPAGCTPRKAPESTRTCTPKLDCEPLEGQWFTGEWSPCTSPCGGKQVRGVLCIGGTGRHLKDTACHAAKPAHQRDCSTGCQPTWYYSDWGQCSGNCTSGSSTGVQRRSVVCARLDAGAAGDAECGPAPRATRACDPRCDTNTITPLTIESQKGYATTQRTSSTQRIHRNEIVALADGECKDRLYNCMLAVQARLCHYKYYIQNCCHSCSGR
ncbi:ADAMTS-like protein 4 isoform X2 [Trichoplusia ni]|uniref:ADAMTS-like protein 4 isoform X2 n=1 Tax=Trichoplusia ni TaxID=7111 RepID=A0A7E5WRI7_TRINI|nr:ADAMTS-like protein 4 isoform X2 [Trichoplusia ni]